MLEREYDELIQDKIEKDFDKTMPVAVVVAWISAIVCLVSEIPNIFVVYNGIVGLIMFSLVLFKKKLKSEIKIMVTILLAVAIGVVSYIDGAFNSAGIVLILMGNMIGVMLLPKIKSLILLILSVGTFVGLWIYSNTNRSDIDIELGIWIVQLVVFILFLIILQIVVYSIRKYLLQNIKDLEKSVKHTYNLAYYDQLTGLPNKNIEFIISYAMYNKEDKGIEDCYNKGVVALTYAKSNKLVEPVAYNKDLEMIIRRDETLKELVIRAIENQEFELYYQKKLMLGVVKLLGLKHLQDGTLYQ